VVFTEDRLRVERERLERREARLQRAVVDALWMELLLDPGLDADALDAGDVSGTGPVTQTVQDVGRRGRRGRRWRRWRR